MFHDCLRYAVLSVPYSLVFTCWERKDLLAPFCVVFSSAAVTFPYVSWSTSELRVRLVQFNMFKPSGVCFTDRSRVMLLLWILFIVCVSCCLCCAALPVHCSLVVTCYVCVGDGGAGFLALLCVVVSCILSLSNIVSWVR